MKHLLLWLSGLLIFSNLQAAPSVPASVFFVPNLGQWDGAFLFYYENGTLSGYVTTDGLTLDLHEPLKPRPKPENAPPLNPPRERGGDKTEDEPIIRKGHVLMLDIVGGKQEHIEGMELLASYSNYFLSRDSCRWRGHVPNYQSLIARTVWPGIDIEYRATLNGIETVFHVQLGADPSVIQLRYRGTDAPLSVEANGSLRLVTSMGTIFEQAPFAFQIIDHRQQIVPVAYHLLDDNTYNLTLGRYDRSRELVIDPLVYCTYFPAYFGYCPTLDAEHHLVIAGYTPSIHFPTTPGSYQDTSLAYEGFSQGVICKFNRDATDLIYATYFLGARQNSDIAFTPAGQYVYVDMANRYWPLTPDAYDTTSVSGDIGLAILSSDGATLEYSTYLGGSTLEQKVSVAVDSTGIVYVLAHTSSTDLPVTANAWHPTLQNNGPFLAMFDPAARRMLECTYLFSEEVRAYPICIQTVVGPGRLWINVIARSNNLPTTPNALQPQPPVQENNVPYFALINMQSHQVEYGSYFGASYATEIAQVAVGVDSSLWLAGTCDWSGLLNMPSGGIEDTVPSDTSHPGYIVNVVLPNTVRYGTYIGGNSADWLYGLWIEDGGSIIAVLDAHSDNFPTTPNAFDPVGHCNPHASRPLADAALVRLSPHLDSLMYGTYFGGNADDYGNRLVYDGPERIWVIGATQTWPGLPVTPDAYWPESTPMYITRFSLPLPDTTDVTSPFILHPSSFSLSCFPNPFNPSTKISFTIPKTGAVSLRVYDVLGREVAVLLDQRLNSGEHSVMFEADGLASGVYFARLETSGMQRVQKMVVMR